MLPPLMLPPRRPPYMGQDKADRILQAVRDYLREHPFIVAEDAVSILDGRDEGGFAWLTLNYLLGHLGACVPCRTRLGRGRLLAPNHRRRHRCRPWQARPSPPADTRLPFFLATQAATSPAPSPPSTWAAALCRKRLR